MIISVFLSNLTAESHGTFYCSFMGCYKNLTTYLKHFIVHLYKRSGGENIRNKQRSKVVN